MNIVRKINDFDKLVQVNNNDNKDSIILEALKCLDIFSDAFEHEDLKAMDDCCHFPHYIFSGNEVIVWNTRGQINNDFFDNLKNMGFKKTVVTMRKPILVSQEKVHFLYSYNRVDINDKIMSSHDNMWILTKIDGKWGIQVRSY